MKIAHLRVVRSTTYGRGEHKSLRGPKGAGNNDPIYQHITDAGFEDGDAVVLITKAEYERLLENQRYDHQCPDCG